MIHGRGDLYVIVKKHKETWKEKNTKRTQKRGRKDGVLDYDYDEALEGWGP